MFNIFNRINIGIVYYFLFIYFVQDIKNIIVYPHSFPLSVPTFPKAKKKKKGRLVKIEYERR